MNLAFNLWSPRQGRGWQAQCVEYDQIDHDGCNCLLQPAKGVSGWAKQIIAIYIYISESKCGSIYPGQLLHSSGRSGQSPFMYTIPSTKFPSIYVHWHFPTKQDGRCKQISWPTTVVVHHSLSYYKLYNIYILYICTYNERHRCISTDAPCLYNTECHKTWHHFEMSSR